MQGILFHNFTTTKGDTSKCVVSIKSYKNSIWTEIYDICIYIYILLQ